MKTGFKRVAMIAALLLPFAATAHAQTYVGSWEVDSGPQWSTDPPDYTGIEAAELLFGAAPAGESYEISINGPSTADISQTAWESIYGEGFGSTGGTAFADDAAINEGGTYNEFGTVGSASSAYVNDHAIGPQFTNYAFLVPDATGAPEIDAPAAAVPAVFALGLLGVLTQRRKKSSE